MNIEKLKRHLTKTPLSDLRKEWSAVEEFAEIGPNAIELVQYWAEIYTGEFHPIETEVLEPSLQYQNLNKTSKYFEVFFCNIVSWKIKQKRQLLLCLIIK
jgi:hypothetical protein